MPSGLTTVIANVNHQFHQACFEERYATLFYAVFDPATRILRYINAGHNPPLVRRADSRIEWLETGGAPVGLFQSWPYTEGTVMLGRGDVLVAYTDGIVEAQDALGEEWGASRLPRTWKRPATKRPRNLTPGFGTRLTDSPREQDRETI